MPRVLLIGGLDPSGGAGITADARSLLVHGCDALPVLSAVAVQNRRGMRAVEPASSDSVRAQLEAAVDDGPVDAIKTGLLGSAARVREIAAWLERLAPRVPLVVDPVLSATAGGYDAGPEVACAYREALAPRAWVFTPNDPELRAVSADGGVAALLASGCKAVLHKGGHGDGPVAVDRLHTGSGVREFAHERLAVGAVHGTGCALATAIAARIASGESIERSTECAIEWLHRRLRTMTRVGADELPRALPIGRDDD